MIFNKEDLVLSLQEKANTKIENLRQSLAESVFADLNEELYFIFDKSEKDIVGGPYDNRAKAVAALDKDFDGASKKQDLKVMSEKDVEKMLGESKEFNKINEDTPIEDVEHILQFIANMPDLDEATLDKFLANAKNISVSKDGAVFIKEDFKDKEFYVYCNDDKKVKGQSFKSEADAKKQLDDMKLKNGCVLTGKEINQKIEDSLKG
jgi:hypothetical protein